MKKGLKVLVSSLMAVSLFGCQSKTAAIYTAGTYTGEADGFGGKVKVTITTDTSKITDVQIEGADETPSVGGAALEELTSQITKAQSAEIDGVSGATVTSTAVKEALAKALESASGKDANNAELTYTEGTYTGTAEG